MISQGLVGFFDILGYQNIIDNNTIYDVSNIVSNVLLKLPDKVREEITKLHDGDHKRFDTMYRNINSTLISDSILLTFSIDAEEQPWRRLFAFFLFKFYVAELLALTFREGVPVRGAIDFGDFFLKKYCFAGRPIINCYRVGQLLDFSGCIMTSRCRDAINTLIAKDDKLNVELGDFGYEYLCPCRDQTYERFLLLSWSVGNAADIRQAVFEAFKAHNKDMGPGVERKLTNTELILRFLRGKEAEATQPGDPQPSAPAPSKAPSELFM